MTMKKTISDGSTTWPVNDYCAKYGAFSFEITPEAADGKWYLCCCFPAHVICLLDSTMQKLAFDAPEQIVALFRDHSRIEEQWFDFRDRITSMTRAPFDMPVELADESKWLPTFGPELET